MERIEHLSKHYDKLMQEWPDITGEQEDIDKCCEMLSRIKGVQFFEKKIEVSPEEAKKLLNDEIRICRELVVNINREIENNIASTQKEYNDLEEAKQTAEQMIGVCRAAGMTSSMNDMRNLVRNTIPKQRNLAKELFNVMEFKFREIDRKLAEITQDSSRAPAGIYILEQIYEWDKKCEELATQMEVDKQEYIGKLKENWEAFYNEHVDYKKVIYEPELKAKEIEERSVESEVELLQREIRSHTEYKDSLGFFKFGAKKEAENKLAYLQQQLISKKEKLEEIKRKRQVIFDKIYGGNLLKNGHQINVDAKNLSSTIEKEKIEEE